MAADKAAFFVEGDGGGAVAGAHLQGMKLPPVGVCHVVDQLPPVASALTVRVCGNVLDLQKAVAFISDNAHTLDPAIFQHVHSTLVQIPVDHVLLLVGKEQKVQVPLFIGIDSADLQFTHR